MAGPQETDIVGLLSEPVVAKKILTCLPLKDAVRTTVLCKNTRDLWKITPRIDFSEQMARSLQCHELNSFYKLKAVMQDVLLRHSGVISEVCFAFSGMDFNVGFTMVSLLEYLSRNDKGPLKELTIAMPSYFDKLKLPGCVTSFVNLKDLRIEHCEISDQFFEDSRFKEVTKLGLLRVGISGAGKLHEFLKSSPGLEELNLGLEGIFTLNEDTDGTFTFVNLVDAILKVSVLTISEHMVEFLATTQTQQIPQMVNLTSLAIGINLKDATQVTFVLSLLGKSPNINTVYIEMLPSEKCGWRPDTRNEMLDLRRSQNLSMMHQLRKLKVGGFSDSPFETKFVALILARSPNLRRASFVGSRHLVIVKRKRGKIERALRSLKCPSSDVDVQVVF